ncbi:MAG: hypothetical protein HZB53_18205 [Chloroflexi bacterium]|nr:hypothetical protein [Chloroflexota bacterium]
MITKIMGLLLFLVGLFLIILSILALLSLGVDFGVGERLMIFIGGLILCVLGFIMARDRQPAEEELQ